MWNLKSHGCFFSKAYANDDCILVFFLWNNSIRLTLKKWNERHHLCNQLYKLHFSLQEQILHCTQKIKWVWFSVPRNTYPPSFNRLVHNCLRFINHKIQFIKLVFLMLQNYVTLQYGLNEELRNKHLTINEMGKKLAFLLINRHWKGLIGGDAAQLVQSFRSRTNFNFFHNLQSKFALYCDGHLK